MEIIRKLKIGIFSFIAGVGSILLLPALVTLVISVFNFVIENLSGFFIPLLGIVLVISFPWSHSLQLLKDYANYPQKNSSRSSTMWLPDGVLARSDRPVLGLKLNYDFQPLSDSSSSFSWIFLSFVSICIFIGIYIVVSGLHQIIYPTAFFIKYNIVICGLLVLTIQAAALRPSKIRKLTWSRIEKWQTVPSSFFVGQAAIGILNEYWEFSIVELALNSRYANFPLITVIALAAVGACIIGSILEISGRRTTTDPATSNKPAFLFYITYGWVVVFELLIFTLALDNLFLTTNIITIHGYQAAFGL